MSDSRRSTAALIVSLALLSSCSESAAGEQRPTEVEVLRGPLNLRWAARAELRPARTAELRAATDGTVAIVFLASDGALAAAGEVVARLDTSELRARRADVATQLEQCRRQVAEAEARQKIHAAETRAILAERQGALRTARFDLDTYHDRSVTLEEAAAERAQNRWARAVDDARLALQQADLTATSEAARLDAQLLGAQQVFDAVAAGLADCEAQIESTELRAPFGGHIVRLASGDEGDGGAPLGVGSMVHRLCPLLAVVDTSTMIARVRVPAAIGEIDPRAVAEVDVDALPGRPLAGVVADVAPAPPDTSPRSAAYRAVDVSIETPAGDALAAGMSATVTLDCAQIEDALYLPLDAIEHDGGAPFVWKVTAAGAVSTPVEVGRFDAAHVEILGGLVAGDRVRVGPRASPDGRRR